MRTDWAVSYKLPLQSEGVASPSKPKLIPTLPMSFALLVLRAKALARGISSSLFPEQPPAPVASMCGYSEHNINEMWRVGRAGCTQLLGCSAGGSACIACLDIHTCIACSTQLEELIGHLCLPLINPLLHSSWCCRHKPPHIDSFLFFFFPKCMIDLF